MRTRLLADHRPGYCIEPPVGLRRAPLCARLPKFTRQWNQSGPTLVAVNDLVSEALRMPDAAVQFARGVSEVRTPQHLIPLRTFVREQHGNSLAAVHAALYERFDRTSDDYLNVFRAAAEMAVMERVGRDELPVDDRRLLRQLWEALLSAQ